MPKIALIILVLLLTACRSSTPSDSAIELYIETSNVSKLREVGKDVLPAMVRAYESADDLGVKARIAEGFYKLSWKSEAAKEALMQDIATENPTLRLQVQWALGKVSSDPVVVENLLDIMQNDDKALFRDKAACALASDQVHLTGKQRFVLISGLVGALSDDKAQVRNIAIKALKIQTGQTKGYRANASEAEREATIAKWNNWLGEYEKNL